MKRILSMILTVCLAACLLSGCGDKKEEASSQEPSTVPTVTPTAAPVQMAKAVKIKADSGLNVRASASTEGDILGLAETGSKLPLLVEDDKDGWYQVQYEGKPAYVSSEYVDVVEVTLEEYNKLKDGGESSASSEGSSPESSAQASSASSKPEGSGASKASPAGSEDSSAAPEDSEDGE